MISVCLASYNGEKYIHRQVTSIIRQLGPDDELVVSDDGSSDRTHDILNSINDNRIHVFNNSRHGVVHNFENALKHAKGDFIFLSDQDDEWMPDKVSVCMGYLERHTCVISDCIIEDGMGAVLNDSFYRVNNTQKGKLYNLLIKNGYLGCCMAIRKGLLLKALPFPENIPMHDIWMGNVAAFNYDVCFIPHKLIRYCRHGDNASTTAEDSHSSIEEKIRFRWNIIKHLISISYRK